MLRLSHQFIPTVAWPASREFSVCTLQSDLLISRSALMLALCVAFPKQIKMAYGSSESILIPPKVFMAKKTQVINLFFTVRHVAPDHRALLRLPIGTFIFFTLTQCWLY